MSEQELATQKSLSEAKSTPEQESPKKSKSSGRGRRVGKWLLSIFGIFVIAIAIGATWFFSRYEHSETMQVEITEYNYFEYPENPGQISPYYGRYDGRRLELIQKGDKKFDFVFHPNEDHIATVTFRDVDVSLMTPGVPDYVKDQDGLRTIGLVDRQWNRQQVFFPLPSDHVEVEGGDGYEEQHVVKAALAKNCLNAGLWEVILYGEVEGKTQSYYHGWFTFPMGHYKRLWEQNTGLSYWEDWNWYRMEHWLDPAGAVMEMGELRSVSSEREVEATYNPEEKIIIGGEQVKKQRTLKAPNVLTWDDFTRKSDEVRFATFIPPGLYDVETPRENEFWRIASFDKAILRQIKSPASDARLHELELVFGSTEETGNKPYHFFVGGLDLTKIPQLPIEEYAEGLYMPMGIGIPPFYQTYEELVRNPPQHSSYYSFLLDGNNAWLDHHTTAIDGPVMHWDEKNPATLHLYFLSYERHSLVRHFEIHLPELSPYVEKNDEQAEQTEA